MDAARQTTRHVQTCADPGKGNALQACVATLLGRERLEQVPNFIEAPDYMAAVNEFLAANSPRLALVKVELKQDRLPLATAPGTRCVLAGKSPRGEFKHCVVARVAADGAGLELDHDPHPDGTGVTSPLSWAGFVALRLD